MDIFQLTYFLTQACLGEITQNFRKIYLTVSGKVIKSHFFLVDRDDEEIEQIYFEILSIFEMLIDDTESYIDYEIHSEIMIGRDKELIKDDLNTIICVFSRKEV
ncbi:MULTISPECIES: hypothetical protein [unclassified Acinetobacter]|uniref:hypothetical protein n=1 Tax=unclassified Acinetobacter TaxID=196816 RepID=UPI0025756D87|nr:MULTISPECIES: hypothetical protein [unclassified Acinetobacter]MDM1763110.1 hypothetical protein [Acinetobacter sp. 226-1]MDM1766589.1 hypothetical protein [Acinetobacter sp. 226-4]